MEAKGALFNNDKKDNDKQPDVTGNIEFETAIQPGKYRLAGWREVSKNGTKYISLKLSEFRSSPNPETNNSGEVVLQDIDENEKIDLSAIPF